MNRDGLAIVLYSYEKGILATIKAIKDELAEGKGDKPKLVLPPSVKGMANTIN
jgi:hypothetical protein